MKNIKRLLRFLKPHRKLFFIAQISMLAAAFAGLAFPWTIKNVLDMLLDKGSVSMLIYLIGVLAFILVLQGAANYYKNYSLGVIGQHIVKDLRVGLFEKIQWMSVSFFHNRKSGDIISGMTNDINTVQSVLSISITYFIQNLISLVFAAFLILRIDAMIALSIFIILPLIIVYSKSKGEKVKSISKQVQEKLGVITSYLSENISGIDVIRNFALEKLSIKGFTHESKELLDKSVRNIKTSEKTGMVVGILNSVYILVIIGFGGYRIMQGLLTTGELIAFILYAEMISGPVSILSGIYVDIQKASAAGGRIFDILDAEPDIKNTQEPIRPSCFNGGIQINKICFEYKKDIRVLHDVDINIASGETVAFIGPSGSGKSTLFKLISRFYDVSSGAIMIDDVDIREMDIKSLRDNIAVVPQDTYLFGMSIRDNIACGRLEASEEEIINAAKHANAHEFIIELENGYDTQAGEKGCKLSGGQRQRIAIARAFLREPGILLLDEPTASLDNESETKVLKALEKLSKARTTLIIAHRIPMILKADRIILMDKGRIIGNGPHEYLSETCPLYMKLMNELFMFT